jgi:predicted RNA binding protein YcfA (HicA-like mRNA interferase family)
LSAFSGPDTVKAFGKIGYSVDHQTGSHIILRHPSGGRLTVPNHRELAKGTLRTLIREVGLTKEQFDELLRVKEIDDIVRASLTVAARIPHATY